MPLSLTWTNVLNEDFALQSYYLHAKHPTHLYEAELELHRSLEN